MFLSIAMAAHKFAATESTVLYMVLDYSKASTCSASELVTCGIGYHIKDHSTFFVSVSSVTTRSGF